MQFQEGFACGLGVGGRWGKEVRRQAPTGGAEMRHMHQADKRCQTQSPFNSRWDSRFTRISQLSSFI